MEITSIYFNCWIEERWRSIPISHVNWESHWHLLSPEQFKNHQNSASKGLKDIFRVTKVMNYHSNKIHRTMRKFGNQHHSPQTATSSHKMLKIVTKSDQLPENPRLWSEPKSVILAGKAWWLIANQTTYKEYSKPNKSTVKLHDGWLKWQVAIT